MTTVDGGRLFRNDGGGKFADVTTRAGFATRSSPSAPRGSTTIATGSSICSSATTCNGRRTPRSRARRTACEGTAGPMPTSRVAPKLYRNRGGGRFEDVTARAGLEQPTDKAMGVAVLDYNRDGWPDVFVGSDRVPAKLYRNDGRGRFVDEGVARRRGPQRKRRRPRQHGRGRGRLRSFRPPASGGRQLHQRDARPLSQPRRRRVRGCRAALGGRPREPAVRDVGRVLPRLRSRWLPRHLRRQRRDRRVAGDGFAGAIEPAAAGPAQPRQRHVRERRPRASAPRSTGRSWDGARRTPISTATAISTSPSRPWPARRTSFATTAAIGTTGCACARPGRDRIAAASGTVVRVTSASGAQIADGAQRVELRVAERAHADVRSRPRHARRRRRRGVAVGRATRQFHGSCRAESRCESIDEERGLRLTVAGRDCRLRLQTELFLDEALEEVERRQERRRDWAPADR